MAASVGQCPQCRAVNSYQAQKCLDCQQMLPWAGAVASMQAQTAQAQAAAQEAQAQAAAQAQSAQQAVTQARLANAATARGLHPPAQNVSVGLLVPQEPVNPFEIYMGAFLGRAAGGAAYIGRASALWLGIIAFVVAVGCAVVGAKMMVERLASLLPSFLMGSNPFSPVSPSVGSTPPPTLPVEVMVRLAAIGCAPFVALVAANWMMRTAFGTEDAECGLQGDVFVAGLSMLPYGLLCLIVGLVGAANPEVIVVASIFALCYTLLAFYNGCTIISRMRDSVAAFCVPLVLLLSGWITKVLIVRIFQSMM